MCGIFAYIGNRSVLRLLLSALHRLEYRGYDSAGIAIHKGNEIHITKKAGRVQVLEDACSGLDAQLSECHLGIAHTRWATHGKPCDVNAHPHSSMNGQVVLIHNGIIENYASLKSELMSKGYKFVSETDTEVLCNLISDMRSQLGDKVSWVTVVSNALSLVVGTYGLVVMVRDDPDLLIAARKGSPLVMGIGDEPGEFLFASDGSALVAHTKNVVYLNDFDIVECRRSGYKHRKCKPAQERPLWIPPLPRQISSSDETSSHSSHPVETLDLSLEQIEKGGYKHFMLKEICDQPNSISNTLRGRIHRNQHMGGIDERSPVVDSPLVDLPRKSQTDIQWGIRLGGLDTLIGDTTALNCLLSSKRIILLACGTSWHAALLGRYIIEQAADIETSVEYASEFRYRDPIVRSDDVCIAVSQSGETADTLEAIRVARKKGARAILGVVNVVGSSIARETDAGIYLHAGPEIGVASTKAFTSQVMVLCMLASHLGLRNKKLSSEKFSAFCSSAFEFPQLLEGFILSIREKMHSLAHYFRHASNFLFLGRGLQFPVALEAALKLKEISYIHAEGYPAAEMKHGPIALIDRMMPVVAIALKSDPIYEKVRSNIEEVKARSGELLIVAEEGDDSLDNFASLPSFIIKVPRVHPFLQSLVTIVPLQLLCYYIADLRGCAIDNPRNLAKSVTVE